jgi:hypothetical protein
MPTITEEPATTDAEGRSDRLSPGVRAHRRLIVLGTLGAMAAPAR